MFQQSAEQTAVLQWLSNSSTFVADDSQIASGVFWVTVLPTLLTPAQIYDDKTKNV